MRDQIETLVQLYFQKKDKTFPGGRWIRNISKQINDLLDKGIQASLIEEAFTNDIDNCWEYIRTNNTPEVPNNLIEKETFYYYPKLQITPPPPTIYFDEQGNLVESQETFYLKIREVFTLDEVLEYFYKTFPGIRQNYKRDIASIEYMYNKVFTQVIANEKDLKALDLLLFTIDTAAAIIHDTDTRLMDVFRLEEFIDDGLLVYRDKRDSCVLAGINHVI